MLSERLNGLLGKTQYGPNCWNATIMYFDPTVSVGFTEQHDMEKWLKKNTWQVAPGCEEVGDILVMREDNMMLLHTAVLVDLDCKMLFHKGGIAFEWEIISKGALWDIYGAVTRTHQWRRVGPVISKI